MNDFKGGPGGIDLPYSKISYENLNETLEYTFGVLN